MEIHQMLKIARRWWWLALIPVIVVGGYVGLTYRKPATTYQVVMRFTAGGEPAALSVDYDRYYAWLSSEYIANALADIAKTGRFAEAVAVRLGTQGLTVTPAAIQTAIASDNVQSIFIIYLTWPDPEQIAVVAEAVSAELTQNGAAYFPQIKGVGIAAQRVDSPTPIALPPSLRTQLLGPGVRLTLALAIGLGLIALAHYFDPMVREHTEVEQSGLRVLAAIPKK